MKKKILFLSIVTAILLFVGCSAEQKINVGIDGNGTIDISVEMEDFLVTKAYLLANQIKPEDLPPMNERVIFDEEATRKSFEETELFVLESFDSPSVNKVEMKISFNSIDDIVSKSEKDLAEKSEEEGGEKVLENIDKVISYEKTEDGVTTVKFYLDKKNFKSLAALIPEENAKSLVNMFAPNEDYQEEEEEYIGFLSEFLDMNIKDENGEPTMELDPAFIKAVKAAKLKLEVKVEGEVVSIKGGEVKDGVIYFNYRILDILLMENPLDIEVVFKDK